MQIAQIIASYTLGGADLLRRAMGKKKPEAMAKERVKFVEGAQKNGVDKAKADEIFDLMEKFAEYGFNKSHSAAYARSPTSRPTSRCTIPWSSWPPCSPRK